MCPSRLRLLFSFPLLLSLSLSLLSSFSLMHNNSILYIFSLSLSPFLSYSFFSFLAYPSLSLCLSFSFSHSFFLSRTPIVVSLFYFLSSPSISHPTPSHSTSQNKRQLRLLFLFSPFFLSHVFFSFSPSNLRPSYYLETRFLFAVAFIRFISFFPFLLSISLF